MSKQKLDPEREIFCNLYVKLNNASEAFRQAKPISKKWKPETVHSRASVMLAEEKVQARIKEIQEGLQKRHDISKDKIVNELKGIIETNVLDYIEVQGSGANQCIVIKDLSQLTKEQQKSIKSIEPTRDGIKVEFHDKITALDRLSKMFGYDAPKKIDATTNGKDIVNQPFVIEVINNAKDIDNVDENTDD